MQQSKFSRYNTEQLKTRIACQYIMTDTSAKKQILNTLHYTICSKQGHTVSFLSNQRLLIFDERDSTLFYINQIRSTPFKKQSEIPKPKNDFANINMCIVKRQHTESNILVVMFNKKIQDGKQTKTQLIQWKFIMANKQLAKQWEQLIKEKKLQKMAKAIGVDAKDKKNLGTISDTLSFGLMGLGAPEQKKLPLSPVRKVQEQPDESADRKEIGNFFLSLGKSNVTNNQHNKQSKAQLKSPQKHEQSEILPTFLLEPQYDLNGNLRKVEQQKNKPQLNSKKSTPRNSPKNIEPKINKESPRNVVEKPTQKPYFKTIQPIKDKQIKKQIIQRKDIPKQNQNKSHSLSPSSDRQELNYVSNPQKRQNDWNYKFLENRTQKTIKDFTQFALKIFRSLKLQDIKFQQNKSNNTKQQKIVSITQNQITLQLAESTSKKALLLKQQFKNYHYIIECLKQNNCIGVPLTCLIKHQGVVCLAKAALPDRCRKIQGYKLYQKTPFASTVDSLFKQLQMHTKIQTDIIKKTASVLNLTVQYGLNNGLPRVYVDNLTSFLPRYPETPAKTVPSLCKLSVGEQVRPELILYNFTRIIDPNQYPTQTQTTQQIQYYTEQSLKQLAEVLVGQQKILCNYSDLKQLMHYYGLSLSALPSLYYIIDIRSKKQAVKHVRKLLQTVMAAMLIAKFDINPTIDQLRKTNNLSILNQVIQGIYRKYCQGQSAISDDSWKKLTSLFKKQYQIALVSHQIEGGILMSSLMQLIDAEYDLTKLNKNKKILYDKQLIQRGFVKKLKPTVYPYSKYQTKQHEQIMELCSSRSTNNMAKLQNYNIVTNLQKRSRLFWQQDNKKFITYVSRYIDPFQQKYNKLQQQIIQQLCKEPPTYTSHYITINCLCFSLRQLFNKKQTNKRESKQEQLFKLTIQKYGNIIKFWLGEQHPFSSDLYDQLSQYHYILKLNCQESIKYLRQSLSICKKYCGQRNYKTASKYNKLGQRQLQYGIKREAKENLYAAKDIYSDNIDKNIQDFATVCCKIAGLQLSQGNIDISIQQAKNSIIKLQKRKADQNLYKTNSIQYTLTKEDIRRILIQNYCILSRAYQLQQRYDQMKKLCIMAIGKVINEERNPTVFDKLLKMCVFGVVNGLETNKLIKLKQFIKYCKAKKSMQNNSNSNRDKNKNKINQHKQSRQQLFRSSNTIMDKLLKLQNVDKIVNDINSSHKQFKPESPQVKQFMSTFQNVINCIGGYQMIQGIIDEKIDFN